MIRTSVHSSFGRIIRLLPFGLLAGIVGCGGSSVGTVEGTVSYRGTPLTAGTVTFYTAGDKSVSGTIDPHGKYVVAKVPVGSATIGVMTPPAISDKMAKGVPQALDGSSTKPVPIPGKYADAKQSGLSFEVKAGDQEHPIELQ
jgi:hypothetical protein